MTTSVEKLERKERAIRDSLKKRDLNNKKIELTTRLIIKKLLESNNNTSQANIEGEIFDMDYSDNVIGFDPKTKTDKRFVRVSFWSHTYNKGESNRDLWVSKDAHVEYQDDLKMAQMVGPCVEGLLRNIYGLEAEIDSNVEEKITLLFEKEGQ